MSTCTRPPTHTDWAMFCLCFAALAHHPHRIALIAGPSVRPGFHPLRLFFQAVTFSCCVCPSSHLKLAWTPSNTKLHPGLRSAFGLPCTSFQSYMHRHWIAAARSLLFTRQRVFQFYAHGHLIHMHGGFLSSGSFCTVWIDKPKPHKWDSKRNRMSKAWHHKRGHSNLLFYNLQTKLKVIH